MLSTHKPNIAKTLPRLRRRSLAPDLRNPSHETWKRPGCLLSCLLLRFMKCGIFWSQLEIISALVHSVMNQQQEMEVDSRFKLEKVPDNDIRNGTRASIRRLWESQHFSSADLETISCLSKSFLPASPQIGLLVKDDGLSVPATIEHSSFDCGRQRTCH